MDVTVVTTIASGCAIGGSIVGAVGVYLKMRTNGRTPHTSDVCPAHQTIEDRLDRGEKRFDGIARDIREQGTLIRETRESVIRIETKLEALI